MLKYIVFDFDGTLVDSKATFITTYNQIAQKNAFKQITLPDVEELRQLSITERCRYLGVPLYRLPFLTSEFVQGYRQSLSNVLLINGMRELLQELSRRNYQLAIISSNAEKNIRQFLQQQHLEIIRTVYTSHNLFGKDKLIKKFLKFYKLQPQEIIYIGDEQRDVIACQKNNVKIIWAGWGYDGWPQPGHYQPDYLATVPGQILEFIS